MPTRTKSSRPSRAARRGGYVAGIIIGTALLVVLNAWPGWQSLPFLTSDTSQVLWLVNLAIAAGLAANIGYLFYDPPWLRSLGDLVTTSIGLAAAIRVWQVFPFDFGSAAAWATVLRVLLILAIVGSCIGILVNLVLLVRQLAGHTGRAGHATHG